MSDKRYDVYVGRQCWRFSVRDTKNPCVIGGKHLKDGQGRYRFKQMCECSNTEDAELICKALNALEEGGGL